MWASDLVCQSPVLGEGSLPLSLLQKVCVGEMATGHSIVPYSIIFCSIIPSIPVSISMENWSVGISEGCFFSISAGASLQKSLKRLDQGILWTPKRRCPHAPLFLVEGRHLKGTGAFKWDCQLNWLWSWTSSSLPSPGTSWKAPTACEPYLPTVDVIACLLVPMPQDILYCTKSI